MNTSTYIPANSDNTSSRSRRSRKRRHDRESRRGPSSFPLVPPKIEFALLGTIGRPFA